MSRQILSYSDLDTEKPSSGAHNALEPPRKRKRTEDNMNGSSKLQSEGLDLNGNNRAFTGDANVKPKGGKQRKNRTGNPSGVPWMKHWDSQPSVTPASLTYSEDPEQHSGIERNHAATLLGEKAASKSEKAPTPSISQSASNNNAQIRAKSSTNEGTTKDRKGKTGKQNGKSKQDKLSNNVPTFGEDWDDSALIDAWNAAEEQYRLMNGGKKWRLEPVKHSSLWNDVPESDNDENDGSQDDIIEKSEELAEAEQDIEPFLEAQASSVPNIPLSQSQSQISSAMDEAFQKAKEASYSMGYWTAVYQLHAARLHGGETSSGLESGVANPIIEENEDEDEDADEVFAPTQR